MEYDLFKTEIERLIKNSKESVFMLKRKLNFCVSKSEYDILKKYINLNQENIIYLSDIAKDFEETNEIYTDEDLAEFFENIQEDIDKTENICNGL